MISCLAAVLFSTVIIKGVYAQVDARMLQYPDVSATQITFAYAGDIWVVSKDGGVANRLSSPAGAEMFPKFSPDGNSIAFSGNYEGNIDVYVIPADGGMPKRLTWYGSSDRVVDWNPDGKHVLIASGRESGTNRFSQFYLASVDGGMLQKLPIAYGEMASYSPDGKEVAFTDKTRLFRTWKRYKGGWAADIYIFNLDSLSSTVIVPSESNDELPMWSGHTIYFLSDRGPETRYNLWSYDLNDKSLKQLTNFKDMDIHFPSLGPRDIVFEAGGKLYLYNLSSGQYHEVKITVVTDDITLTPKTEKAEKYISSMSISPDGKRGVFDARGDLFSVPAEKGYVLDLTRTSGVAERYPSWSPDGKSVAYWSDRSGEYELTLMDLETGSEKQLTHYGPGYRYQLYWSPDSKKIAFVDQAMNIKVYDLASNNTLDIDKGLWLYEGNLENFSFSWSADSRWLTYSRGLDNRYNAIFIYDTRSNLKTQVTSGFYNDTDPVFDPEGKYLYYLTCRHFQPSYSDIDNTFIYSNSTQIAVATLRSDVKSPLSPENDAVSLKKDEEKPDKEEKAGAKDKKGKNEADKTAEKKKEEVKPVEINLQGMEARVELLPAAAGNYTNLQAVKGKIAYQKLPNTGSGDKSRPVKYYDLDKREEKTLIDDADMYLVSANGEKVLVYKAKNAAVVSFAPDQKMEKTMPLGDMDITVNPKAEWKQIFTDAWRFERDFFYDKNMHGVDWNAMRVRYGKMLDNAVTREDVNYVIGEMIAELSSSHSYRGGGDIENAKRLDVGYLGTNWEVANGHYRIKSIIKDAVWDVESRSPLSLPGAGVKEGDYVLAVNGVPMDISKEPYAAFQGLGGKTIELTVNSTPSMTGAKKVVIKTMTSEGRLRNLEWIENNRKRVEEATGGKAGYIYVPNTGINGQDELVRQFAAQMDKQALIIDERFNSGGQIPDRFIELLNRKPLAYWAVRDGKDWQWPPVANFGPKVMLINGWSGSGGDAFPDYFRKAGLGPLIGTRTWGGLIGISGAPRLIDGGVVTVPTFRMYDPDGKWFKEGHGVDPDIQVKEDPGALARGNDPQLQKAIEQIQQMLKTNPYIKPERPPNQKR